MWSPDRIRTRSAPLRSTNVEVLLNGVRRALVPALPRSHLRWHRRDEFSKRRVEDGPSVSQMFLERMRLILGEHQDTSEVRVEAVAECEIDDPILPAERYRRFGPMRRQGMQTRADATGKDQR